jgi:hypothetical protein
MKEIFYLIIDITAGGWAQYNSLSVCRNLLGTEQIANLMCEDPNFLNYLVGMASIHRFVEHFLN